MAFAETVEAAVKAKPERNAELRGRVDAVDEGRIFGWAWSPARPGYRLEINIFVDDDLLATVVADKPRVDLRRNGIGDGKHAFDLELPENTDPARLRLRVVAVHPEGGPPLELRVPSDAERAAEAVLAAPLEPILARLEATVFAQRRIQSGHTTSLRELTHAAKQLAEVAVADGGLVEAIRAVREGQQAIADRLAEVEVVFVRFDAVLGEFHRRLDVLARQSTHGVLPHFLLLTAGVGLLAGIALAAATGL